MRGPWLRGALLVISLADLGGSRRCPYCLDDLTPIERTWLCARCATAHHEECASEHGSCAVFGCGTRYVHPSEASLSLWETHLFRGAAAIVVLYAVLHAVACFQNLRAYAESRRRRDALALKIPG